MITCKSVRSAAPRLFGDLVAADRVDELCLTVAAVLAGGDAGAHRRRYRGCRPWGQLQLVGAVEADAHAAAALRLNG